MTTTFDPLTLSDFGTEMVSLHDDEGRFLSSTPLSIDVLGQGSEELSGRRLSDLVHPEDARALELAFEDSPGQLRRGTATAVCRLRHADGSWAWQEITVRPASGASSGATVVVTRPADELVAARQSARWAEESLRRVFDHAPTPMATIGLDNRFERVNPAFCSMLGSRPEQLVGRSVGDLSESADGPGDRFALAELVSGRVDQIAGTLSFRRVGQGPVIVDVRRTLAHSATGRQHVILHVLSAREGNVLMVPDQPRIPARPEPRAEQTRAEPKAERPAPDGGVTGLTSRTLLLDRLTLAVARPERESHFLVMFFVELAGTTRVLNRWDRRPLESVMATTGNRLRAAVRPEDTVARFGDGRFVVLCPLVAASADIVALRQRLAVAVSDGPVHADGRKLKLTATIGAAVVGPREACDADDLLDQADRAMAPAAGGGARR